MLPKVTVSESGEAMDLIFMGGEPQRDYVIESSRDLIRWLPLEERWLDGGPNSYYDDDARYLGFRFYRLRDRLDDEQVQRNAQYLKENFIDQNKLGLKSGAGYYEYPNPAFEAEDFLTGSKS